jgi:hypothetical protein
MAEFGVVAPVGREGLLSLTDTLHDEADDRVPAEARHCLMLAAQLRLVNAQILENDRRIRASARATDVGRRLMGIPGVGPVLASAFVATVPDPHAFRSGRNLAAWIGLVPRQNSSGGKERLGGITKQGNCYLRQLLFVGAIAVIRYAERHGTRRPWLVQLLARRTTKAAAAALANKTARMVWAIMTSGQPYNEPELRAAWRGSGTRHQQDWEGRNECNATSRSIPGSGKTHFRHCASSACYWSGPDSAEGIMASGRCAPHQQVEHMAAPTSSAEPYKIPLAKGEPSTHGDKPPLALRPLTVSSRRRVNVAPLAGSAPEQTLRMCELARRGIYLGCFIWLKPNRLRLDP